MSEEVHELQVIVLGDAADRQTRAPCPLIEALVVESSDALLLQMVWL